MKVTVCFGNVRVVVPCGDGDMTVQDLVRQATLRYKKATGKTADSWVAVQSMQTSDGGILDPDDKLNDVVDDREQILAVFSDGDGPHHGGGDGASGSSVGTSSPDIFHGENKYYDGAPDIEVTPDQMLGTGSLQVRRGSEPALNQIEGNPNAAVNADATNKRWSAAAPPINSHSEKPVEEKVNGYHLSVQEEEEEKPHQGKFQRDGSSRLSMQFLTEGSGMKWMEAMDRVQHVRGASLPSPVNAKRKEPLGQANSHDMNGKLFDHEPVYDENVPTELIVLHKEGGPLGIHVVPDYDSKGRDRGLLVQGIEPGGRVARDGRLALYDRIIEINGSNLLNKPFQRVQEIFKNSLSSGELRLRVVKHQQPKNLAVGTLGRNTRGGSGGAGGGGAKALINANTRRLGKKLDVELVKGAAGLGFSITTRDNAAGGGSPVYIKSILSKGAAVDDGRLRPGDRLLQVNGIEMTGKTQAEAVQILREIPNGAKVLISVSRQDDTPQQENAEKEKEEEGEVQGFPWRHREVLTFDIPVHDTEKAGLGVSVKGKTTNQGPGSQIDLGIFVKSVLNGGAASRDGRLRTNDQLMSVNGKSLLNQSNAQAMETLRRAMLYVEGPKPGVISLTVARKAHAPTSSSPSSSQLNDSSVTDVSFNSDTSQHSTSNSPSESNTVIYLPNRSHSSSQPATPSNHPVIDRLTGGGGTGVAAHLHSAGLRNESYYRATHETTWNMAHLNSPSGGCGPVEPVLIEEDYHVPNGYPPFHNKDRIKSMQRSEGSVSGSGSISTHGDVTYASQQSLEDPAGFTRDAVGRQSMSEKRHATLDAKNTDTYRRNKKLREERDTHEPLQQHHAVSNKIAEIRQQLLQARHGGVVRTGSAESVAASGTTNFNRHSSYHHHQNDGDLLANHRGRGPDVGPALGMKKSSSLESLQTLVQEIQMADDSEASTYRTAQGANNVRVVRGRGCNESFRAAVDRSYEAPLPHLAMDTLSEEEGGSIGDGTALNRGGPRQSSMNAVHDAKNKLKKKQAGSLLKGIGSMFRFGKHRKSDSGLHGLEEHPPSPTPPPNNHYQQEHGLNDSYQSHQSDTPSEASRSERMQQLRLQHQQRKQMQQMGMHAHVSPPPQLYGVAAVAAQAAGSRSAIASPASPFSHYVNYEEIQQHINRRRQQHYHSQRRDNREPQHSRPVSNFYEYETVQSVIRNDENSSSLPRNYTKDTKDDTYQRQSVRSTVTYLNQLQQQAHHHHRVYQPSQHHRKGPFISHITIKETPHENGS